MDQYVINMLIALVALLVSFYCFYLVNDLRKNKKASDPNAFSTRPLQLQAYERLVMLAERISIPNLVSRANQPGMDARQMQRLLIESIKQEFEYNTTQQIYVSPVAWKSVTNLKDQNMLIINQIASGIQAEASGTDLNRRLLEFTMSDKRGTMHDVVMEALNFEAKKIMK
ncbi:MAG: hypothetical protein ABIR18_13825 [Chitinophagaceae bacterium]